MVKLFRDKYLYLFTFILFIGYSNAVSAAVNYYGFIMSLLCFSLFILNKYQLKNFKVINCFIISSVPFLFAIVYSIFLIWINECNSQYLIRGLSFGFKICFLLISAYAIVSKYRSKSCDFLFVSFSLSYFFITLEGLVKYGFSYLVMMALDLSYSRFVEWNESGSAFNRIFEVHDFGLTMPLIALYYIWTPRSWKEKLWPMLISFFIALLSAKRIALGAVLVVFLVYLLTNSMNLRRFVNKSFGILFVLLSYIYLLIIYNGSFFKLADKFDMGLMGRDRLYQYFINKSHLGIDYLGHGFGYISKHLEIANPLSGIMGVHNDILRIYVELGMIGSLIFWILSFYVNFNVKMKLSKDVSYVYILCSLYALITYFTDNTITYGLVQMSLAVIPIALFFERFNIDKYERLKDLLLKKMK